MHNPLRTRIGFPGLGIVGDSSRRVGPLRQMAPRNGLVLECYFDGSGTDTSGYGNNFGLSNVSFTDNDVGYARYRSSNNGSNNYALSGVSSVSAYSFMFSFKPATNISGGFQYPFARGDGGASNSFAFFIYDHSNGGFQRSHCIYTGATFYPCQTTTALSAGNEYFIGGSYDGQNNGVIDVIVNGVIENSLSITGTVATTYATSIGCAQPVSFAKCPSEIGFFRLFDRKLTPAEWRLHYLEYLSMAH